MHVYHVTRLCHPVLLNVLLTAERPFSACVCRCSAPEGEEQHESVAVKKLCSNGCCMFAVRTVTKRSVASAIPQGEPRAGRHGAPTAAERHVQEAFDEAADAAG